MRAAEWFEIRHHVTTNMATCQIILTGDAIDAVAQASRKAITAHRVSCG
ncbi:MAG: hypothetical protein JO037_02040 [Actinobacteria bacterium]|nr:hypothetical protein [Actinomycetota bacterium]